MALCAALMLAGLSVNTSRAHAAPRDRSAPSQPASLRVVSSGAYHVSLSWEASSDNSGFVSYRVYVSDGRELAVAQGATSLRVGWGLFPARAYSFAVIAFDAVGNRSRASNVVSVLLPPDVTAPSAPALALVYAGSEQVTLSWPPSREDGPSVLYEVSVNARPVLSVGTTTVTLANLTPDTSYAFSVRARDGAGNWSPESATLTVRTQAQTGSDVTPPAPPTQLAAFEDDCGDVLLVWNESLDDRDAPAAIRYQVYVNGSLQQTVQGSGWAAFNPGELGMTQLTVVAVDSAGNASLAAATTLDIQGCDPA